MSTHNIGFYVEISKIISLLSSNIIKYALYLFFFLIPVSFNHFCKYRLDDCVLASLVGGRD